MIGVVYIGKRNGLGRRVLGKKCFGFSDIFGFCSYNRAVLGDNLISDFGFSDLSNGGSIDISNFYFCILWVLGPG